MACYMPQTAPRTYWRDRIIAATGLPAREVLGTLLNLELRGIVEQKPGKTYTRKEP